MTVSLLRYHPPTADALQSVLLYERREELKRQHLGNLVWYVARYLHPGADIELFSTFCDRLEQDPHGVGRAEKEAVVEAVESMILAFLPRGEPNA